MRLDATPEAERQMLDASAWWRANRPSAANLFDRTRSRSRALLGASPAPATQSPGASRERPSGDLLVTGTVRVQDTRSLALSFSRVAAARRIPVLPDALPR